MSFELPAEYAELQATVRKLAQEKVAPRAREIDLTGEYPQDLFEAFRDERYAGEGFGDWVERLGFEVVRERTVVNA